MIKGYISKCAGIALAGALSAAGAAKTAPKDVEDALRGRVQQFYQLMVDKKYRAAEELVAPESRDTYYTQEKPTIEDFHVGGIMWEDNFTTANLTMTSKVQMRNARIGTYEEKVPYASHWKLEDGQWFWFIPNITVRETPFGVMKVDPAVAEKSNIDLKAMIAKGPTAEAVRQGIDADRTEVRLLGNKIQEVKLQNKLAGPVNLRAQILSGAGFDATLQDSDVAGSGKTKLTFSRRRGVKFKPGRIAVLVQPTGQVLQIAVE